MEPKVTFEVLVPAYFASYHYFKEHVIQHVYTLEEALAVKANYKKSSGEPPIEIYKLTRQRVEP